MKKVLEEKPAESPAGARDVPFTTISGGPREPLYGPGTLTGFDYPRELGDPGQFPFTRGVHATMYRGKPWTMRQFAGFGTPGETNARFKYLLENGGHGRSVAFDLPPLLGGGPDHPPSLAEGGQGGGALN